MFAEIVKRSMKEQNITKGKVAVLTNISISNLDKMLEEDSFDTKSLMLIANAVDIDLNTIKKMYVQKESIDERERLKKSIEDRFNTPLHFEGLNSIYFKLGVKNYKSAKKLRDIDELLFSLLDVYSNRELSKEEGDYIYRSTLCSALLYTYALNIEESLYTEVCSFVENFTKDLNNNSTVFSHPMVMIEEPAIKNNIDILLLKDSEPYPLEMYRFECDECSKAKKIVNSSPLMVLIDAYTEGNRDILYKFIELKKIHFEIIGCLEKENILKALKVGEEALALLQSYTETENIKVINGIIKDYTLGYKSRLDKLSA